MSKEKKKKKDKKDKEAKWDVVAAEFRHEKEDHL